MAMGVFYRKWEVGCPLKQISKNWKRRKTSEGISDCGNLKVKSERKVDRDRRYRPPNTRQWSLDSSSGDGVQDMIPQNRQNSILSILNE